MPPRRARPRSTLSTTRPGVHALDLALLYAELERVRGVTQADIARTYRKSPGYVSVLCRLGRALRTLPVDEREALRVPHLTFKAAQTAVSRTANADALLATLRQLAAARPPARRRRSRTGTAGAWAEPVERGGHEDLIDPVPLPSAAVATLSDAYTFTWDAAAAARDPAAALAAYEQFVRATTAEVVARLRRTLDDRALELDPRPAAVGPAELPDSAADAGRVSSELSLRQLTARVDATLMAHRERMAQFLAERAARDALRGPSVLSAGSVTDEERDADFA